MSLYMENSALIVFFWIYNVMLLLLNDCFKKFILNLHVVFIFYSRGLTKAIQVFKKVEIIFQVIKHKVKIEAFENSYLPLKHSEDLQKYQVQL